MRRAALIALLLCACSNTGDALFKKGQLDAGPDAAAIPPPDAPVDAGPPDGPPDAAVDAGPLDAALAVR